eukprot:CAMPEP_0168426182 /NCGR_PEP_ID=MMETSP0228-20121227/35703_1 /TAXON_ID=133427 /ORGANISM="Protoceratium reticulatum, Strain CCCM 535 (=CCMP 1889)" /LENGTH=145 /DNA_ID=CAMNT_0008440189 /DNA_START=96 /DNA_END=530 /DNA_ORIENTATION=-
MDTEEDEEEAEGQGQDVPAAPVVAVSQAVPRIPRPEPTCRALLTTAYAAPPETIGSIRAAAEQGVRCHLLGSFAVAGATGACSQETRLESLIRTCCCACGHTFAWNVVGHDICAAKRRRQALPCGHWIFRLEYRFCLELRDASDS